MAQDVRKAERFQVSIAACIFLLGLGGADFAGLIGCAAPGGTRAEPKQAAIPCGPEVDHEVESVRASLAEDPDNERLQMKLAEAESKAADCHVQRARRYRADRNPREALKELEVALRYVPVHPEALMLRERLRTQGSQAEQRAWEAAAAADEAQWRKAYDLSTQALQLDRTLKAARQVQIKARGKLVPKYLASAEAAIQAGRHADALKALEQLDQVDPNNAQGDVLRSRLAGHRQRAATQPEGIARSAPASQPVAATQSAPAREQLAATTRPTSAPASRPAAVVVERKPEVLPAPTPIQPSEPVAPAPTAAPSPPPPAAEAMPPPAEPVEQARMVRVHEGVLSRDDDRYAKEWRAPLDNILIKVKDTDDDPVDADIEIEVGEESFDLEDQRQGAVYWFMVPSKRMYRFALIRIEDENETIWFTLDLRQ